MGHFTIHEAYIFWKYYQNWTRDFEIRVNFVFFCLIKLYKNYFLTHFRYSPVLLLNRPYKTQFFNYKKGGLMTVDGCWKIAIFNKNSNLHTLKNWQKLEKKVYDQWEARTGDLEDAKRKSYYCANFSSVEDDDFLNLLMFMQEIPIPMVWNSKLHASNLKPSIFSNSFAQYQF